MNKTELIAAAAEKAGLKFDANDKKDVQDVVSWVQNIYANLGFAINGIPFKNFLTEYVGEGFKTSDIEAAAKLVEELGGEVVKIIFLMELAGLEGRKKLENYDVASVVCYEGK